MTNFVMAALLAASMWIGNAQAEMANATFLAGNMLIQPYERGHEFTVNQLLKYLRVMTPSLTSIELIGINDNLAYIRTRQVSYDNRSVVVFDWMLERTEFSDEVKLLGMGTEFGMAINTDGSTDTSSLVKYIAKKMEELRIK